MVPPDIPRGLIRTRERMRCARPNNPFERGTGEESSAYATVCGRIFGIPGRAKRAVISRWVSIAPGLLTFQTVDGGIDRESMSLFYRRTMMRERVVPDNSERFGIPALLADFFHSNRTRYCSTFNFRHHKYHRSTMKFQIKFLLK